MKKNRTMKAASILLALCLMTSCFVGGTFAKYTSSFSADDNARVAAWGFGSSTFDFDLFSNKYDGDDGDVVSTTDVIAPGTSQTATLLLTYSGVDGTTAPEVKYTVELNVKSGSGETAIAEVIEKNKNIKWSFNNTTYEHTLDGAGKVDLTNSSWDKMIAAVEAYREEVAAGALPVINTSGIAIGWSWAFSVDPAGDEADTDMGNAADLADVKVSIELVATQVGE